MILNNLFRASPTAVPGTGGTLKSVATTGGQNANPEGVDSFAPSPRSKMGHPVQMRDPQKFVDAFVKKGFQSLLTLGKDRLLPFNVAFDSLEEGIPLVAATGESDEKPWVGVPEDLENCQFKSRGVVVVSQTGLVESLKVVFMNPENHPIVLDGIIRSKIVKEMPPQEPNVFIDAILVQETEEMQFVTHLVGRRMDGGVSFVQKQLNEDEIRQYEGELFPEKPSHWLNQFLGQIQILETATGTVVIMEFTTRAAGVPAGCGNAADPGLLGDVFASEEDLRKTVKGRIETRLKRMILAVTDSNWARKQGIHF